MKDDALIRNVKNLLFSNNSRLEFLTLIGIIFNALMQGYICSNAIYTYLIKNWKI